MLGAIILAAALLLGYFGVRGATDGTGSEIHEITVQDREGQIFHMVGGELRDMFNPGSRLGN